METMLNDAIIAHF